MDIKMENQKHRPFVSVILVMTVLLLCACSVRGPSTSRQDESYPPGSGIENDNGKTSVLSGQGEELGVGENSKPSEPSEESHGQEESSGSEPESNIDPGPDTDSDGEGDSESGRDEIYPESQSSGESGESYKSIPTISEESSGEPQSESPVDEPEAIAPQEGDGLPPNLGEFV